MPGTQRSWLRPIARASLIKPRMPVVQAAVGCLIFRHRASGPVAACSSWLIVFTLIFFLPACGKIKIGKTTLETPSSFDTILLKNGGLIQGRIVRETPDEIEIKWQDGVVGFKKSEVVSIKRNDTEFQGEAGVVMPEPKGDEKDLEDPATYPRVYLKKGEIKKGASLKRSLNAVILVEKLEGGGAVEFEFPLSEIEKIMLWPPAESEPTHDFKEIEKAYPSFRVNEKPHYFILSDDDPLDLNFYMKALEQFYQEFLIYFLDFLKKDYEQRFLQAVIFGQHVDFQQLLQNSGFPEKSNILGFFSPENQILFLYNIKSVEMINRYLHKSSDIEEQIKDKVDIIAKRYSGGDDIRESRIKGEGERILERLEKDRVHVEGEAREETVKTIRHEGAHQLLYEFGVHRKKGRQGAWLVEGLASFCEPPEIGEVHLTRLMELKFQLEDHHLMPLEYLLSFAAGADIHKLEPAYISLGYAQSWAFVHFLMTGPYRDGFLNYVREVAAVQEKNFDEKQDAALLEKNLGKSVKEIEKEFIPYVNGLIKDQVDPAKYEDFRLRMVLAL